MIITAINQVKRSSRYEVYADDNLVGTLSADMILTYRLHQGQQIDEETLASLVEEAAKSDAWQMLLGWLAAKPYTIKMATDKLLEHGFGEQATQYALDKAIGYNYINDEEYAREMIDELNPKRSTRRIKQDLFARGISGDYVDELLTQNDESQACKAALNRKLHGKPIESVGELKTMQSLATQGYRYDVIRAVVAEYKEQIDESR